MINLKYSVGADMMGLRPGTIANRAQPEVGDVFVCRTENGPIEYVQVIGVYEEAAQIEHIRFRLVYGYQDKTAEMGERTLAGELFRKRVTRRFGTSDAE
jgi:hypothetical protein